jgi:hypothetical protein
MMVCHACTLMLQVVFLQYIQHQRMKLSCAIIAYIGCMQGLHASAWRAVRATLPEGHPHIEGESDSLAESAMQRMHAVM